jgi:hypothetical protein
MAVTTRRSFGNIIRHLIEFLLMTDNGQRMTSKGQQTTDDGQQRNNQKDRSRGGMMTVMVMAALVGMANVRLRRQMLQAGQPWQEEEEVNCEGDGAT